MAEEIALLEEALEATPGNWKTRRFLIDHWIGKGDESRAAALVAAAPELPDNEGEKLFAAEVLGKRDAEAGHRIFDGILAANPANAAAHLGKARLFLDVGEVDKAEEHLNAASAVEPSLGGGDGAGVSSGEGGEVEGGMEEEAIAVAVAIEGDDDSGEVLTAVAVAEEDSAKPVPIQVDESAPVAPRSLCPPGAGDGDSRPDDTKDAVSGTEESIIADGEREAVEDAGRAFIVVDGEAIPAHAKDPDTKEKLSALTVALLVHVVIVLSLGLYVIAVPRPPAPQITVSATANPETDDISNETVQKMQKTQSSPVAAAMPVISTASYSDVAIPEVTEAVNDLAMVSMTADTGTGFGMSMGGFGDVSNMGAIPTAMRSRCSMSQRMKRLRESGGDPHAERVVRTALEWLALNQIDDGSGGKDFKCAMTGVALLAFLGHCETPESPKYGKAVVNAALYLMDRGLKNDGKLWNKNIPRGSAYTHAMATYGLAELYTMTKESGRKIPRLETVLRKAAKIIVDGQDERGGWNYGYKRSPTSDLSVGGWQFQALKALHNTGRGFSGVEKAMDKAVEYIKGTQDSQGAFKYNTRNSKGKKSMAVVGMLALQLWHQEDSPEGKKAMAYNKAAFAKPVVTSDYYTPYYATQVFFLYGGEAWENYNAKFQKKLLEAQNEDGSWSKPNAGHGNADSQILATCWATLTLEVYYRYLPTTDKVEGLKVGQK